MSNYRRRPNLRIYHFGATLLAIGILLWGLVWVQEIRKSTTSNLQQTYCNQGLLTLATLNIWVEEKLVYCPQDLLEALRRNQE